MISIQLSLEIAWSQQVIAILYLHCANAAYNFFNVFEVRWQMPVEYEPKSNGYGVFVIRQSKFALILPMSQWPCISKGNIYHNSNEIGVTKCIDCDKLN